MSQIYNITDYHFTTEYSKDIEIGLIIYAEKSVDRNSAVHKLNKILFNVQNATTIEEGIFEFSLLQIIQNDFDMSMISCIYNHKLDDIIFNLETSDLKTQIKDGLIKLEYISFMSPSELNPANWKIIKDKLEFSDKTQNDMATTDQYKCKKCGEKKSQLTSAQTRSADEPATKFITCMVCYHTVKY